MYLLDPKTNIAIEKKKKNNKFGEKKIKQKEKGKDIFYSSNVLLAMVMIYDGEGVDKTNLKQKSTKKGIVKERKKAYIWYTLGLTANYKKEIIAILISWTRVSKIHVVILFFFFCLLFKIQINWIVNPTTF